MKKKFYFMNKPEYIMADKNNKIPESKTYFYKDAPHSPSNNGIIKVNSNSLKTKYSKSKKIIYVINFFIIFFMIAYWVYFNRISNKPMTTNKDFSMYEKSKYFLNDNIIFSLEKIIDQKQNIICNLFIYNVGESNLLINKDYQFEIFLINNKNQEIKLKSEKFIINKKILAKNKINVLSIKLDKTNIMKSQFLLLSINVNNYFTLYKYLLKKNK